MNQRKNKIKFGQVLASEASNFQNAAIFQYEGITSNEMNGFRQNLRNIGVKVKCAGNLVQNHALKDTHMAKIYSEVNLKNSNFLLFFNDLKFKGIVSEIKNKSVNFVAAMIEGGVVFKDPSTLTELAKFSNSEEMKFSVLNAAIMPISYIAMFLQYCYDESEKGVKMSDLNIMDRMNSLNLPEKLSGLLKNILDLTGGESLQLLMALKELGINFAAQSSSGKSDDEGEAKEVKAVELKLKITSVEGMKKLEAIQWLKANVGSCSQMSSMAILKLLVVGTVIDKIYDSKESINTAIAKLKELSITAEETTES